MKITPVILSGGSGTRLWPISRSLNPKQFLDFFGKNSLFQKTVLRVSDPEKFQKPIVICNSEHRFIAAEELQKIKITAESIILESVGRNTAPAITIAALKVTTKGDDNIILVMPSDHIIANEKKFITCVENAVEAAQKGYLVTFGITPNKAETGYGYLKMGSGLAGFSEIFAVEKFVEKPKKDLAETFLKSGKYLWNSGIFMFKASVYLEAVQNFQNEIFSLCQESLDKSEKDLDFIRLSANEFEKCPNISIDYAVMEKSEKVVAMAIDVGWSDVGSWETIADLAPKDNEQNTLSGNVVALKTKNCYITSEKLLVAAIGVENLIVVALKDAVLIANKNNAQDVKELFEMLKKQKRDECNCHSRVLRPWGSFEVVDVSDRFKAKRIIVNSGASLSLQLHNHRAEHWVVVKGKANVTRGSEKFILGEDQSTYIPTGEKHRLENLEQTPLEIIEIQTGFNLSEDDIVRFSDIYGR